MGMHVYDIATSTGFISQVICLFEGAKVKMQVFKN